MARWYIIHAYSGFENKVKEAILSEAERMGLAQLVEGIEVPTETVTEVKRGKKVSSERTSMAGYVLAKLTMTDDVYHLIRNTPKVTGFLGVAGKPQAVRESEALRMLNIRDEAAARPKQEVRIDYDIGDQVKLLDGPFASFTDTVEGLDFEKGRVKVGVSIFGRATPVDIEFDKVQVIK